MLTCYLWYFFTPDMDTADIFYGRGRKDVWLDYVC